MSNKNIDSTTYDVEKDIIRNLSYISFLLICILINLKILSLILNFYFIELKDLISIIWAIFVFWYWYKTYERNKELWIIDKYSTRYNEIKAKNINYKWKEENYRDLINLFYEEYYLYLQWYISNNLWNTWKWWIITDMFNLIEHDSKLYKRNWKSIFLSFLKEYIWNIGFQYSETWRIFIRFLIDILEKYSNSVKKEYSEIEESMNNNKFNETEIVIIDKKIILISDKLKYINNIITKANKLI